MAEKHENPLRQFLEVYGYRKKKRIIIPEGIGFQAGWCLIVHDWSGSSAEEESEF